MGSDPGGSFSGGAGGHFAAARWNPAAAHRVDGMESSKNFKAARLENGVWSRCTEKTTWKPSALEANGMAAGRACQDQDPNPGLSIVPIRASCSMKRDRSSRATRRAPSWSTGPIKSGDDGPRNRARQTAVKRRDRQSIILKESILPNEMPGPGTPARGEFPCRTRQSQRLKGRDL